MGKKRGVGDEAMRYLSHRMRTEQEMRQHLKAKEYEDSEIEGAIDDLKAHHYIDDYEYALAFYRNSFEKLRGGMRAKRELEQKGIDTLTADNALEDYKYEAGIDELANARRIAMQIIYGSDVTNGYGESVISVLLDASADEEAEYLDEHKIASVARKLENRGYTSEVIYKVISEMRSWKVKTKR
ncbi:regulatory protein RecX [Mogibacterium pumilum]|uniref:Regulatory protein RecX n=1 Tax=Mogibacterium pumilum TaxID=86332 RepID=A0A223ARS0_9FIRM|nr:RecX family transcriptional regulator [Mogibacterium pumilum]ASS37647.1 hypothetical protein AXF17_03720 [Mogibacterium pumilum]